MTTRGQLVADVASWMNRSDLPVDTVVRLAEADIAKVVRTAAQEATATITMDAQTKALPDDFLSARSVTINGTKAQRITQRTPNTLRESGAWGHSSLCAYALEGNTITINYDPSTSDTPPVVHLVYLQRFAALGTDDSATNWLLTNHYDVYLFACCMFGALFVEDGAKGQVFEARYKDAIEKLAIAENRKRMGGSPTAVYRRGAV